MPVELDSSLSICLGQKLQPLKKYILHSSWVYIIVEALLHVPHNPVNTAKNKSEILVKRETKLDIGLLEKCPSSEQVTLKILVKSLY